MTEKISFDIKALYEKLNNSEDWVKIIVTQIHLDHSITETMKQHMPMYNNSYGKENSRTTLPEKIKVCDALGLIGPKLKACIEKINTIRNSYAHNLNFIVSEKHKQEIYSVLKDATPKHKNEELKSETFAKQLLRIIMYVEVNRIERLKIKNMKMELQNAKDYYLSILSVAFDLTSKALERHTEQSNPSTPPDTTA